MDENEQLNMQEPEKKPRRKKSAARWAILEQVPVEELKETMGEQSGEEQFFRISVDNCKSEKAAKQAGRDQKLAGRVLLVCIHGDGQAEPRTQTDFSWKK